MELTIGTNIKKLRLAKGMTQEQLAYLLNVSTAAVSKWEAQNTYPDITMLFPLANVFGVSVDELMGYGETKIREDKDALLSEYRKQNEAGAFEKAREIIREARKTYPNDFLIMHTYMWELAGGFADNQPEVLLNNYDEFMQICSCILGGCTEENLRLDALTMKAKLLHASGDIDGALKVLEELPDWYHSAAQKTEQLFSKETPEFRYWVRKNTYDLLSFAANKLVKTIWYDDVLSLQEKIVRIECIGDAFSAMQEKDGTALFTIPACMIYAEFSSKLAFTDETADLIRIIEKHLHAEEKRTSLAENDSMLKEWLKQIYHTENKLKQTFNYYRNAGQIQLAKHREAPSYKALLMRWQERII